MQRTSATLKFRAEQFRRHAELRGLKSEYAIAKHIGVNRTTVMRLFDGTTKPGGKIIAGVLLAFPDRHFEDFFEVGTDEGAA